MRPLTLALRLAMAAAGVFAPWLLLASGSADTPAPRQASAHWGRLICDPRVPSRRALARVAFPSATRRMVLRDIAAQLQRNCTKGFGDADDAAIQNDPSAVGVEEGQRLRTVLEPIGILAASPSPLLSPWTLSPRSPRGPPNFS